MGEAKRRKALQQMPVLAEQNVPVVLSVQNDRKRDRELAAAGIFDKYNIDLMPKGTMLKSNEITHVDGGVVFYTDKK